MRMSQTLTSKMIFHFVFFCYTVHCTQDVMFWLYCSLHTRCVVLIQCVPDTVRLTYSHFPHVSYGIANKEITNNSRQLLKKQDDCDQVSGNHYNICKAISIIYISVLFS